MTGVAERLAGVRRRIDEAAAASGRDPARVTLVAVSKRHPPEAIREAYGAGQRDFGENYAQELRDKASALADLEGLRWHAIGPLQSNKARYVAGKVELFHALDRPEVALELGRRGPTRCLVEVNVGEEEQKGGVLPGDLPAALLRLAAPGITLAGLMCIPPLEDDPEASRASFRLLRALRDRHLPGGLLSMGMSADFEVAIREGSDIVRVGTAIFGARPVAASVRGP